jgi:hypothetical protein
MLGRCTCPLATQAKGAKSEERYERSYWNDSPVHAKAPARRTSLLAGLRSLASGSDLYEYKEASLHSRKGKYQRRLPLVYLADYA